MTKEEVVANFKESILPSIPVGDEPALAEAWNWCTDLLCKAGDITPHQYNTWTHPKISKLAWAQANSKKDNHV